MAVKPLMLKEHLALDSSSESREWAPLKKAAGTTLRCLLEAELRSGGAGDRRWSVHVRSHSKSALTRLSNVIKAVNALQFFSAGSGNPANSLLYGSLAKKLRRGFWRRNGNEKERNLRSLSEETVETSSFFSPSPVVSSCRSSFNGGDSACSDFVLFSTASSPQKETFGGVGESFHRPSADNREHKENYGKATDCPLEEEKEQFSPVSVMEFPYKDDDDDGEKQSSTTSPSSQQSLSGNETTKHRLRRFLSRAELRTAELDRRSAGTETHFEPAVHVACEDEEERRRRRRRALSLLQQVTDYEPRPANEEKLLFEFFAEGLSLPGHRRSKGTAGEEELMRVATGWVSGDARAAEEGGDVVVGEMERTGGWRRFEECADTVVAEMSRGLLAWLMEELVGELSPAAE